MSAVKVKFVSRKVNKVRWRPKSSSVFITGSYDDTENNLCVWKFPDSTLINADSQDVPDDADPESVCSAKFQGGVTDLKVISDDLLFASSTLGSVYMFSYSDEKILCSHSWEYVHRFRRDIAAATGIAVKGQEIASVGEDGRLCVFNFNTMQKIRDIESSDLCSFTAVSYLRYQEVLVGNSLGYMRVWDLRMPSDVPTCLLAVSRDQPGLSSMNIHPTQAHVLATGHEDGSICFWDMRQGKQPTSVLEGHSAAITELLFHPTNPDFLYTCSFDGCVWQWDSSSLRKNVNFNNSFELAVNQSVTTGNPWLNSEAHKHKLEIISLFSQPMSCVNTLDFSVSVLLWGTDNEALYMLNDIAL